VALVVLVLAGVAGPVFAQQVRVKNGPVAVLQWHNASETVGTVETGAILQVIERDGDWIWIVLPADAFGTRRVGWIPLTAVEPTALKEGMPVLQLTPDTVTAQPSTPPPGMRSGVPPGGDNWLIEGLVGTTFGTETAEFYGGALAFHLTPTVQMTVEIGRFDNIVSEEIEESAAAFASRPEGLFLALTGRTLDVVPESRVHALYGILGARALLPTTGRTRPYAGGGVGLAGVEPEIRLKLGSEDITSDWVSVAELPPERTRMLVSVGGGVNIDVMRGVALDLGYRFARVFYEDGLNVNRVYLGLAWMF
jgi:opacity protein-like surface antigen